MARGSRSSINEPHLSQEYVSNKSNSFYFNWISNLIVLLNRDISDMGLIPTWVLGHGHFGIYAINSTVLLYIAIFLVELIPSL